MLTEREKYQVQEHIKISFREDFSDQGDHSSKSSFHEETQASAVLISKDTGIIAGIEIAELVFHFLDPELKFNQFIEDGQCIEPGMKIFELKGRASSILSAERLALNYLQRMSGIATITAAYVDAVSGTKAQILDTRKTSPGLRVFEKMAVKIGGGKNHRFGLYDMIMLKDNHNDYAGGITNAVNKTKAYLKEKNLSLKVEVETRNLDEVKEALAVGGVDRIMLDNFTPERIVEALQVINGQVETEASGGINETSLAAYAATNVDFISIGALTHSVKSMDISLKETD